LAFHKLALFFQISYEITPKTYTKLAFFAYFSSIFASFSPDITLFFTLIADLPCEMLAEPISWGERGKNSQSSIVNNQ